MFVAAAGGRGGQKRSSFSSASGSALAKIVPVGNMEYVPRYWEKVSCICCHEAAWPSYFLHACFFPDVLWTEVARELTPRFKDPENPTEQEQELFDAIRNNTILAVYFAYDIEFPDYIDTCGDNTTEWFEAYLTMRRFKTKGVKPMLCNPKKLPKQKCSRSVLSFLCCAPCIMANLM